MENIKNEFGVNEHITPKNDIVFKKIFGSKGNEKILQDFLESILDIKIGSLILDLSTELLPEFYNRKQSRVDVRTILLDGTEVNIEMQIDISKYSDQRCLQHWSKLYSNSLKSGKSYKKLHKTICIWILDGNVFEGFSDFHSKWEIANLKHGISNRFNELEFHMIELNKFRNDDIMKKSKKKFWLWFIDHSNGEMLKMAYVSNERIREAREQLDKIRSDPALMERIRLEEAYEWDVETAKEQAKIDGHAEGRAEGKAEGITEGIEKQKKETAIKMIKKEMKAELISELTELSIEEIEKIKLEINK